MTTKPEGIIIPARLLYVEDVAKITSYSTRHIWRLEKRGELKAIRSTTRNVRFDPAEVIRYLKSKGVTSCHIQSKPVC